MAEKARDRTFHNSVQAARAALEVFRADTPRQDELNKILEWVDERVICQTWAELITRSFAKHDDPLIACCEAGRAIVTDYYTRPPLAHECTSESIQESLSQIIGGALFATLRPQLSSVPSLNTSLRR